MTAKQIIYFPLTRMIVGVATVVSVVALIEFLRTVLFDKTQFNEDLKNAIVALLQISLALISYIFLYKFYEKRKINELSLVRFPKNAFIGLLTGFGIQSLAIFIIYIVGGYTIVNTNSFSSLIPGFTAAVIAGFVAEIILRGIFFRIIEEELGTVIALIISVLLFAIMHVNSKGATIISVTAVSLQAGLLISSAYVFSRSLWLPIFFHFAWDFAEPSVYGGINQGIHINRTLFDSIIKGPTLLTGGETGPGNSIQAAIFCLIASILFLWMAKKKGNFIKPYWKRHHSL